MAWLLEQFNVTEVHVECFNSTGFLTVLFEERDQFRLNEIAS